MINLIPNEEKKKRVRDFYFRLVVVFFFTLGSAMLFAVVTLLPAYFIALVHKNVAEGKLAVQAKEPEPVTNPDNPLIIKDLDSKLALIEKAQKSQYLPSEKVINELIFDRMRDIKITEISYKSEATGKSITVRGLAPSRERLLLFRRSLEDNIAFKKVDLPISNFVKGANISFTLTLVPT